MNKIYILAILAFAGCSNVTFNASMCDQIASEPGATIPKECIPYSEEEAQKAFDKTQQKKESKEDVIEFIKEK